MSVVIRAFIPTEWRQKTMPTKGESRRRNARLTRNVSTLGHQVNGVDISKNEILRESEKLVIKPGMKLVWDNELNRMVWR